MFSRRVKKPADIDDKDIDDVDRLQVINISVLRSCVVRVTKIHNRNFALMLYV